MATPPSFGFEEDNSHHGYVSHPKRDTDQERSRARPGDNQCFSRGTLTHAAAGELDAPGAVAGPVPGGLATRQGRPHAHRANAHAVR